MRPSEAPLQPAASFDDPDASDPWGDGQAQAHSPPRQQGAAAATSGGGAASPGAPHDELEAVLSSLRGAPAASAAAAAASLMELTADQRRLLAEALASAPPTPLAPNRTTSSAAAAAAAAARLSSPQAQALVDAAAPRVAAAEPPPLGTAPAPLPGLLGGLPTQQDAAPLVPPPAASAGKPLFNLDVDIGGGRKGRIVVTRGAAPDELAAAFVASHGLPPSVLARLSQLIVTSTAQFDARAGGGAA